MCAFSVSIWCHPCFSESQFKSQFFDFYQRDSDTQALRHPTPVLLPGKSHDGGAWWAAVHGVAKSWTRLSNFPFTFHFHALEKAIAPHSSTFAWKIPWIEETGRLQSMGSLRVGHDWVTSLSLFTFMHWRRKWQPTPVFLPGESQGRGSLLGCRLWGRTGLDTTEVT